MSRMRCKLTGEDQRLILEYQTVNDDPRFSMYPLGDRSMTKAECTVTSAAESPFGGGVLEFVVLFPSTYPFQPPQVVPTQAIHHPNLRRVQETEDLLGEAWKASHSTHDILSRIWTLLSTPQLDMPNIDPQIAAEFTTDPDTYSQKATASARAAGEGVGVERLQRLHAGKADASIERIYEEKATFALADEGVSESPEPLLDDDSDTITLRHVEAALVAGGLLLLGALIGRRIRF